MMFDFASMDRETRYRLLGATIVPRPIAWVSTLGSNDRPNVAPFSFFNVFGEDPATVGFSILHRSPGDPKDTGSNILERGEFVVNLVDYSSLTSMVITAIDFGRETSEFVEADLIPVPSILVSPPRVGGSPVSLECRLQQVVRLGTLRSLVLGDVVAMHVRDDAVIDPGRGHVDTSALDLVGRMGPNRYVSTRETRELTVPSLEAWHAHRKD